MPLEITSLGLECAYRDEGSIGNILLFVCTYRLHGRG